EEQQGNREASRAAYRRLALDYPRSDEAVKAADALYQVALAEGRVRDAREYKLRALTAAERLARERFRGRALPASSTVTILGYRVDLSGLELRLANLPAARELIDVAGQEADRVRSLKGLDDPTKGSVRSIRERMERTRSELWVADMFDRLRVGVPGPPPQPKQQSVAGRVELDGKPLPGVLVELGEAPGQGGGRRLPPGMAGLQRLFQPARYRAVTDERGAYRIPDVPSGRYAIQARYAVRPAGFPGPIRPSDDTGFPETVTVSDRSVTIPPLALTRAVETRTFGERPPAGKSVLLEWTAWPGAAAYRVEVLAAPGPLLQYFQGRRPPGARGFFRRPVLWTAERVEGTRVECPLLPLAPDVPEIARVVQYQYTVTALDGAGNVLARSSDPASQFNLSRQAFAALMAQNPPRRARPGGRGRFGRPRDGAAPGNGAAPAPQRPGGEP
ncbi:MAG TPA: carboxypeptidase-like regulatory domain-containing protein, partial [Armatimonadota bacterium]|nr:carboxypeptidase-like regulatory domain-containing protein [Armatimonadota bacterium]